MKKLNIIFVLVSIFAVTQAFAAEKKAAKKAPAPKSFSREYGMAGCGLGSIVMGKHGGQIFASTTNATAYNQWFAITSGTSNCLDDPNDEVAQRMDRFVKFNVAALAGDISRGEGETIVSLSHMMGCQDTTAVAGALQQNFNGIFPSAEVQPNIVTDSIISVMKSDQSVLGQCKNII